MIPPIISAFLTYTLITALTPGPNNIIALSMATQYGFRRSARVLGGIAVGFLITMLFCAIFTYSLVSTLPSVTGWMRWIGAAYVLWLAWRIARSTPPTSDHDVPPLSFWNSIFLQFVNIKIILYGITALSTFVLPYTRDMASIFGVSIILTIIGCFGNMCWALAGHGFQTLFRQHGRIVNNILAALLIYCAVRMFV
nr:cysteine/O-acetylserine transporter [uncultured Cohaesibacter sp.]